MANRSEPVSGYCYLRLLATLGVIMLHTCAALADYSDLYGLTASELSFHFVLEHFFAWCVPCFVMITGALILKKNKNVTAYDCINRYARRIILALIVFGLPYAVLTEYYESRVISLQLIPNALMRLVANQSFAHMWYLYMLLGIYLFMPFFKVFVDHSSQRLQRYVLGLLFVFNFVLPFISALGNLEIAFTLPVQSCYVFYLLIGAYLTTHRPGWAANSVVSWIGLGASAAIIIVTSLRNRAIIDAVSSYSSPLVAIMAICIFNLFCMIQTPVRDRIWALDRLCFGVYLIHPVIIQLAYRVLEIRPTGRLYPLKTILACAFFACASFIGSWVLSKVKPLKRYIL